MKKYLSLVFVLLCGFAAASESTDLIKGGYTVTNGSSKMDGASLCLGGWPGAVEFNTKPVSRSYDLKFNVFIKAAGKDAKTKKSLDSATVQFIVPISNGNSMHVGFGYGGRACLVVGSGKDQRIIKLETGKDYAVNITVIPTEVQVVLNGKEVWRGPAALYPVKDLQVANPDKVGVQVDIGSAIVVKKAELIESKK